MSVTPEYIDSVITGLSEKFAPAEMTVIRNELVRTAIQSLKTENDKKEMGIHVNDVYFSPNLSFNFVYDPERVFVETNSETVNILEYEKIRMWY